jgi:dihydrofolate reductase
MATVLAGFTISLDGFIADPDDSTENLFDWFNSGDTEFVFPDGKMTVRLSPASAMVMRDIWQTVGAIVTGRRMFDIAHGWGGNHPLNVPVFVVSHSMPELPEGWPLDAPFTFVTGVADGTDALENAIEQAKKVAGEKTVIVAGANVAQQALKAGWSMSSSWTWCRSCSAGAFALSSTWGSSRSSWSAPSPCWLLR